MKNKIIVCILVFALLLSLCGCQLALPEEGDAQRDRLIGCFVTTEHLDLFDFEAYLDDNLNKLSADGNITLDGDTSKYQGRIYAELYEEKYTDSEGVEHSTYNYRFTDLEGIAYFAPTVFERDGQEYVTFQTGEGLSEVNNHVKSHNEDTYYTELSATIYVPVDSENELTGSEICFYMNPVYQAADGSVYLTSGNGSAMNATGAGVVMSTRLSEEYTTTINGEEKTGGGSVEISYETAYVAASLRIIEMDSEGNALKTTELEVEKLPESYETLAQTEYIITESLDKDGEAAQRSIIEPEGEHKDIFVLVPSENGWLVNNYCQVLWVE